MTLRAATGTGWLHSSLIKEEIYLLGTEVHVVRPVAILRIYVNGTVFSYLIQWGLKGVSYDEHCSLNLKCPRKAQVWMVWSSDIAMFIEGKGWG